MDRSEKVLNLIKIRFAEGAIIALVSLLSVEFLSTVYILLILDFYRDDRWKAIIISNLIAAIPVGAITLFFSTIWIKPAIEFDRIMDAGQEPTLSQSENYISSIFKNSRNVALLLVSLYLLALGIDGVILYKYYDVKNIEALFFQVFKAITAFNLGIILYYSLNLLAKAGPHFGDAVERIYAGHVYKWPHFKIGMKYKIFAVMFCVTMYFFCAVIIMGYHRAQNAQRVQLEDNLNRLMQTVRKNIDANSNEDQKVSISKLLLFSEKLFTDSSFLLIANTGNALSGDISTLTDKEIQKIISSGPEGKMTDWVNKKLVLYSRLSSDLIMVAAGKWGQNIASDLDLKGLVIFVLSLLFSVIATFLLVSDITSPIKELSDYLEVVAEGKTDKHLRAYSEDEMGDFSRELARTTALLKARSDRINLLIQRVEETAVALERNVFRVQDALDAQASLEVEQEGVVGKAMNISGMIVNSSHGIIEGTRRTLNSSNLSLESCRMGGARVSEAMQEMKNLAGYVENISRLVVFLGEEVQRITGITGIIEELADQISLLSLNAQLEAAGADQKSRRFMVVAEEVKRLAEKTREAVEMIRSRVEAASSSAQDAVELARKGVGSTTQSAHLAETLANTFQDLEHRVITTQAAAEEVTIITRQQSSESEQVALAIQEIERTAAKIKIHNEGILDSMKELAAVTLQLNEQVTGKAQPVQEPQEAV